MGSDANDTSHRAGDICTLFARRTPVTSVRSSDEAAQQTVGVDTSSAHSAASSPASAASSVAIASLWDSVAASSWNFAPASSPVAAPLVVAAA